MCKLLTYRFAAKTPRIERENEHSPRDKLLITLVRLRRGKSLKGLKLDFGLSETTLSTIFYTWVRHMSLTFKSMEKWAFLSAEKQMEDVPDCYKPFPNLSVVVDCTNVGTNKYGGLAFISDAAEGNISDRKLFLKSGIMNFLRAGEAVMSDKGFSIESDLNAIGVELLIPAFLGHRTEFTAKELLLNKAISTYRIHVGRFIKMLKDFKLIRYQVPNTLLDIVSDIIRVCANLVNFNEPFLRFTHPQE